MARFLFTSCCSRVIFVILIFQFAFVTYKYLNITLLEYQSNYLLESRIQRLNKFGDFRHKRKFIYRPIDLYICMYVCMYVCITLLQHHEQQDIQIIQENKTKKGVAMRTPN